MLEVVFSDSAKGSMKAAKNFTSISADDGSFTCLGDSTDEELKKPQKRLSEGDAVRGTPKDVVGIAFGMDMGDISGEFDCENRKKEFSRIFASPFCPPHEFGSYFRSLHEDFEKLLFAAKAEEPLRVWKSSSPSSACGFAFLCDVLREIRCKISVITLPEYWECAEDTIQISSNWGEIAPDEFCRFLPLERTVPHREKLIRGDLWKQLQVENAPLRAVVSGRLISVPEDFYDHLIIRTIPDGDFTMGLLIGRILTHYPLGVSDSWYALRIKKMITEKKLEIIGDADASHPYGKILRKI